MVTNKGAWTSDKGRATSTDLANSDAPTVPICSPASPTANSTAQESVGRKGVRFFKRKPIVAVVSTLLTVLLSATVTYYVSGQQAVRSQQGLDRDQIEHDRTTSAASVVVDPSTLPPWASLSFDAPVDPRILQPLTQDPNSAAIRSRAAAEIVSANYFDPKEFRGQQTISFVISWSTLRAGRC